MPGFRPALFLSLVALALGLPAHAQEPTVAAPVESTLIKDRAALARLLGSSGMTLQWISWDKRGTLNVDYTKPLLRLTGEQTDPNGKGRLELDGVVTEIGPDYFWFSGRILISGTPDGDRFCERDGEMTFRVTQNRKYWRLQEMEVCDGLTDYVDIYF